MALRSLRSLARYCANRPRATILCEPWSGTIAATRPRYFDGGGFGIPVSADGSDDIDRSNVDAFPQFRHSAAGLPFAPASSRNALAPQCGQTNFMFRLSHCGGLPAQAGGAVVTTAGRFVGTDSVSCGIAAAALSSSSALGLLGRASD
jgi:hypothetical protein